MRRFAYLRDPVFLTGCALYALNRWILKPLHPGPFFQGHFNDLLLIPCALPPVLWIHRQLGLRSHDAMPRPAEIALHLAVWSVICEAVGPLLLRSTCGDPWDVAAYAAGAALAGLWWNRPLSRAARAA